MNDLLIKISELDTLVDALTSTDYVPIVQNGKTWKYVPYSRFVKLTGNESIQGVKTFVASPIVPTPTTDMQASTKKYVDDLHTSLGSAAYLPAGSANGVATLGTDGKIPSAQVPQLVIVDTFVVSNQTQMLACAAEQGDIAVRTDENKTYILKTSPASTLTNWEWMRVPTDNVLSVDGLTGAVDLNSKYVHGYDNTHSYAQYEACFYLGIPYKSLSAGNSGHQPDTSPTYWEVTGGGSGTATEVGYTFDNGQLEKTVNGWTVYANTTPAATPEITPAGSVPSGFGFAWNGTSALVGAGDGILTKPASNCQGAGIYHNFTIDRGCLMDTAKQTFRYLVPSAYVDGYITAFLLDVTNSSFIPVSVSSVPASYGVPAEMIFVFNPSNSTSYRLYLHITTTTTTAWTMEVDAFTLGARNIAQGAAISADIAWIPTTKITNMPGDWQTGYSKWTRIGTNMRIQLRYKASGAATGTPSISLATLLAELGDTSTGYFLSTTATFFDDSANLYKQGMWTDGSFKSADGTIVTASAPFTWAANDIIALDFTVPISQWAGSGTVGLVQGYAEYASNNDVSATASVTATGYLQGMGNFGGFGSGWAIGTSWIRRVRFQQPYQMGRDTISVGIKQISTGFVWDVIENSGNVCSYNNANERYYGYFWQPVSGDIYAIDIYFGSGGCRSTGATYGAAGTAFSTLSSDFQWFVKKTSEGKPGESTTAFTTATSGERIHRKVITGTTASGQGVVASFAHGLSPSKILSVNAVVEYSTGNCVKDGWASASGYLFNIDITATDVRIANITAQSASILSKPVRIVIEYME